MAGEGGGGLSLADMMNRGMLGTGRTPGLGGDDNIDGQIAKAAVNFIPAKAFKALGLPGMNANIEEAKPLPEFQQAAIQVNNQMGHGRALGVLADLPGFIPALAAFKKHVTGSISDQTSGVGGGASIGEASYGTHVSYGDSGQFESPRIVAAMASSSRSDDFTPG